MGGLSRPKGVGAKGGAGLTVGPITAEEYQDVNGNGSCVFRRDRFPSRSQSGNSTRILFAIQLLNLHGFANNVAGPHWQVVLATVIPYSFQILRFHVL